MNIQKILELHKLWLDGDVKGERANLSGADLRGTDLFEANLSGADLRGTDLSKADLSEAKLSRVDLSKANLSGADLREAVLFEACLNRAKLARADLSGADLRGADLFGANLSGAELSEAKLGRARLIRIKGKEIYTMQFNQDFAYCTDGLIKIGCITKTSAEWVEEYERIGKQFEYTDKEIKVYGDWIKLMAGD